MSRQRSFQATRLAHKLLRRILGKCGEVFAGSLFARPAPRESLALRMPSLRFDRFTRRSGGPERSPGPRPVPERQPGNCWSWASAPGRRAGGAWSEGGQAGVDQLHRILRAELNAADELDCSRGSRHRPGAGRPAEDGQQTPPDPGPGDPG
ncbi:hypothetical protein J7E95_38245 [Streptomyces sp. ISL-14]|nr:hypothetical protein [Streptomyces sp. ISL-14]